MSPAQVNAALRQLVLKGGTWNGVPYPPSVDMSQQLSPNLPSGIGPGSVVTLQLRNVGLVKRLVLEIAGTITANSTSQQNLAPLGLANLISNVTFIDLGNNTRINSTGWHLTLISSVKRRKVFGAAYTSDTPNGYGNNNNRVMYAPATIAATAAVPFRFMLEIPFVKNNHDLRGAILANVTNAIMTVQVTFNPQMFVSSTADPTLAVYQSAGSDLASISGITMQVNQMYLDQLPRDPKTGSPLVPPLDIGTAYLLNNTSSGLPVANQDNGIAFVNARSYESVTVLYDNNGTLNVNGSDIAYVAVTSANFTQLTRWDGPMWCLVTRDILQDDPPKGMYYLDFRSRPINTDQYGNMQLILNPSSVGGSAATFLLGWEAYGIIGQVNQGGSLPMAA